MLTFTLDGHLGLDNKTIKIPVNMPIEAIPSPRVTHQHIRQAWETVYLNEGPIGKLLRAVETPHCVICARQDI